MIDIQYKFGGMYEELSDTSVKCGECGSEYDYTDKIVDVGPSATASYLYFAGISCPDCGEGTQTAVSMRNLRVVVTVRQ